ncbi:MAG: Na+/H+ antiporter NhaC family protein, partial [Candidatus Aminicenantes bacterium]|nr:Na+/H+ antiporter NhaC family protein [Candidatus Aminicenantes bacterium]
YYSILSLFFVFLIFTTKRDFGPMLKAERRAQKGLLLSEKAIPLSDFESSGLSPSKFVTPRWYSGIIPILTVIIVTFVGLYYSGKGALAAENSALASRSFFEIFFSGSVLKDLGSIISAADSFRVLLWASLMGVLSSIFIAMIRKILKMREAISSMVQGMKSMVMAILILVMAWSLGVVLVELKTADFLVSLLSTNLDYHIFPAIVFIFSAAISFSTGTSWGTISIMYPLVIPVTIGLLANSPDLRHFLILTISSVLTGSVFGDHCSPISDTTIMSSMASSCDHIDHVKTQIPYSLSIGGVALLGGIIPFSYGLPYVFTAIITVSFLTLILYLFGKKI